MITREEYFRRVMQSTVRSAVQTLLRTKEYSAKFLSRSDSKSIDKEVDKISQEVIDRFIAKLKREGYIEGDRDPTPAEFERMFQSVLDGYIREHNESKNNSKKR